MNIAYACNEAYMEQTSVSIVSLLENNKNVDIINIYFIDMGTTEKSRDSLDRLVKKYGRELIIIDFNEIAYDLKIDNTGRHIASVYAKIFFGRITGLDRILYIDSDTVIVDDLSEYYNIDLTGYYCAAVETIHTESDNEIIGLTKEEKAINDGVVLMNLSLWREDHILEKCQEYIAKWNGNPPVLSEGTINAVCKNKMLIVNPCYNLSSGFGGVTARRIKMMTGRDFYTEEELRYANSHPVIIHYLRGYYNRPWCKQCTHPMKDQYLKYRSLTDWKDTPLQDKKLPTRIRLIGFLSRNSPDWLYVTIYKIFGNHRRK